MLKNTTTFLLLIYFWCEYSRVYSVSFLKFWNWLYQFSKFFTSIIPPQKKIFFSYFLKNKIQGYDQCAVCQSLRCPRVRVRRARRQPPVWPLFYSPFYCKPLWCSSDSTFTARSGIMRPEVIGPLWPCLVRKSEKINYKKIYEDDFAHYCYYYCCYCPPIFYFLKKIIKKPIYSPHRTSTTFLL